MRTNLVVGAAAAALLVAVTARADDLPSGTVSSSTGAVTSGSTDVAKEGFAASQAKKDATDATDISFNAGGLFAAGNSRSAAMTAGAKSRVRRGAHQFEGAFGVNYARAGKAGAGTETTVENIQGLLRYDWYVLPKVSVYGQVSARRDRFQGLDLRLNLGPGVAYYFIQEEKTRLWGELGYDFQYDIRRDDFIHNADGSAKLDAEGNPLSKEDVTHNGRLFFGVQQKAYKSVALNASAEYLMDLTSPEVFRLILDGSVTANINKSFALSTAVTVRYENRPLPDVENTDVTTAVSIVYKLY